MSYNYGQYRYDGNYLNYVHRLKTLENNVYDWDFYHHGENDNEIDDILNSGILQGDHQAEFYDKILKLNPERNKEFSQNETYYLRFKVKRFPGALQRFQVGLMNFEDETEPIALQKIEDYTMQKGQTTTYEIFEIVFSPNQNFDSILFEYHRTGIDYDDDDPITKLRSQTIWINGVSSQQMIRGRHMEIEILQLGRLQDIMSTIGISGDEIVKLGIQSPPGTLLGINGEQIRVGGNGIYEINNDLITVKKLNIVPIDTSDISKSFFIVDYEYIVPEQTT